MTPGLIIDSSITLAWCFSDEATMAASQIQDRLLTEAAVVPALWSLEVANVLLAEKRQRISLTQARQFMDYLSQLEIEVDHESTARAFDQIYTLGRSHQLTSYDAVYLDLALRKGLPLATLDVQLRQAALALGVICLGI